MTTRECISILQKHNREQGRDDTQKEAVAMAISALRMNEQFRGIAYLLESLSAQTAGNNEPAQNGVDAMRDIIFQGRRTDNKAWETGPLVITKAWCSDEETYIVDKVTGYLTPVDHDTVSIYADIEKVSRKSPGAASAAPAGCTGV